MEEDFSASHPKNCMIELKYTGKFTEVSSNNIFFPKRRKQPPKKGFTDTNFNLSSYHIYHFPSGKAKYW